MSGPGDVPRWRREGSGDGPGGAPDDTPIVGMAPVQEYDDDPGGPPPIDPEELAGLQEDSGLGRVRRVQPLEDEPSKHVARYLFPTERFRGEWRRHIIHLAAPLAIGVAGTIVLGWAAGYFAQMGGMGVFTALSVLAWLAVMGYVGWQVADWHFDRFILTNKRVMVVRGIVTRDVGMMPLGRVTDMKYEQSPLGRLLNYGTFILESAGQDQALREVKNLPNPNELYLRVVEEMYEPAAVEARLGGAEDEDEDENGDA